MNKKRTQKQNWKLALNAQVPEILQPCGVFGDTIVESAWLPYENENGKIELHPSIVIKKENEPAQIKQFLAKNLGLNIKGVFPSQDLQTLMTAQAVKTLLENEPLNPEDVDQEIERAIKKHIEIGTHRKIVLKRWIEGTYFYDVMDAFPILNIMGVSESGKSRVLRIIQALSYHAQSVVDPSPASIFRMKEEDKTTLCFDEAEYLNDPSINQTIRVLINASYSKGLSVPRYDEIDGKRVKRKFDLYSPFAIVGISGLEGVTASRAIRIITERSKTDYPIAKTEEYTELRDKLYILRIQKAFELKRIYDALDISNVVNARFIELFKPIFALTKLFGNNEEFQALEDWAKRYQSIFRIEALNLPEEEQILTCLSKMTPLPDDWYLLKDLTDNVNFTFTRQISYKRVSQILSRIGITERRKVQGTTQFRVTRKELKVVGERLGIDIEFGDFVEKVSQKGRDTEIFQN
jgi:hypothetical protein